MTWIIIILVIAVVLGPIMHFVPSAKDKRLTALRAAARRCGLTIKISTAPKLDPSAAERVTAGGKTLEPQWSCTAYQIPMTQNLVGVGELLLLKIPEQPTVGIDEVVPGWSLYDGVIGSGANQNSTSPRGSSREFWSRYSAVEASVDLLKRALAKLPDDTLALSIDSRLIACFWQERAAAESSAVEDIHASLHELKNHLCARFGGDERKLQ